MDMFWAVLDMAFVHIIAVVRQIGSAVYDQARFHYAPRAIARYRLGFPFSRLSIALAAEQADGVILLSG